MSAEQTPVDNKHCRYCGSQLEPKLEVERQPRNFDVCSYVEVQQVDCPSCGRRYVID